jgi:streptogramin lyase
MRHGSAILGPVGGCNSATLCLWGIRNFDVKNSGIATTPDGQVFFASLAGNYLGQIDLETGAATVLEPPVTRQGARRVWSDSRGGLWVTGWNSGDLFRYLGIVR